MNRLIAAAPLLASVVFAADTFADTPWLSGALDSADKTIHNWQQSSEGVAAELQFFHSSLPPVGNSSELPESSNGDAVIVCDRGLLFDAKDSRLVYVGNVRMRDTRLTLHARDNLYLRLEELKNEPDDTKAAKKAEASKAPSPAARATTITPAVHGTTPQPPAPELPVNAKPDSDKEEKPDIPLHIETGSAEANVVDNRIILFSPAGAEPIALTRGEDVLTTSPTASSPARILADAAGNILIEGEDIFISYTHPENGKSTISAKGGFAYYHAENHTLYLKGNIQLTHPDGKLNCTESLCLEFTPEENESPIKPGFMSQFTGMRLAGVRAATAKGNVAAATSGVNGSLPGTAHGDELVYNGNTGDCRITGKDSKLTYGEHNSIYANEGIHLLANGDIELRGSDIHGTYERPAQEKGAVPLRGTFKAGGNIVFTAETGYITTERGLIATDDELDFSCTGQTRLTLAHKPTANQHQQKTGVPNLAIAEYGEVITVSANGQVRAKRRTNGRIVGSLEGEQVFINLGNGSAHLTSGTNTPAILIHESNRIIATPGDTPAVLDMMENGDIFLTGKTITATLHGKNGLTTASGQHSMKLFRAENRIQSGSGVTITAPAAIITTKGELSAILQPAEEKADDSSHAFAGHSFNYIGIKSADTLEGGTVRTEKGSMQCSGAIHVTMDPTAGENHEMAGVQYAVANGNVMLLTKDSTNKMIRAKGDRLTVNGQTGMKSLTGREIILENENNRHTVSGKGAAIHVDRKNNVRISGEKHDTQVTKLGEQATKRKNNNSTQKKK